jgi:hypothetical protein
MARASKPAAKRKIDRQIDAGLENTFPASDPYSVGEASRKPSEATPVDRKPPLIDKALVRRLARGSKQKLEQTRH